MPSELQASFARAVGERLDASVVEVTAAVEDDGVDTGLLRSGRDLLADFLRLRGLVALEALQAGPARARDRATGRVVDDLREDPAIRTEDDEARARRGSLHLAAHAAMPAQALVAGA